MSRQDWIRKHLMELADAIHQYLIEKSGNAEPRADLAEICRRVDAASKLPQHDEIVLNGVRDDLCRVCRRDSLHVCDVGRGWSANCAFIQIGRQVD